MNSHWNPSLGGPLSRREMLWRASAGFGHLALLGLLGSEAAKAAPRGMAEGPLTVKPPHFTPRAKRVIF